MTAHEDAATGVTALLVRLAAFVAGADIATEVLHGGKALAVTMSRGDSKLAAVALHHYGMSVPSVNAQSRRIRAIVYDARRRLHGDRQGGRVHPGQAQRRSEESQQP